ncbi:Muniscin C-terminal mu homology domain-containing protein [Dipodascopsis tothii]|uniref:Muniscin C-terminal mu homology domain-containing protein n=1 Tax=Dipodascopsis tothii TaxID=44089 RepID=UPI0034CD2097
MESFTQSVYVDKILSSLPPTEAVALLRQRLRAARAANDEVVDWLNERSRIEEAYAAGLRRLATRPAIANAHALGSFGATWTGFVQSAGQAADASSMFVQRLARDVIKPTGEGTATRDWQEMRAIEEHLATVARGIDEAEERVDKVKKKGARVGATRVAGAHQDVNNAIAEWDNQAPLVFDKFQGIDEGRLLLLKNVLTRYQTCEVDKAQTVVSVCEGNLNSLLSFEPADEVQLFATQIATNGAPAELREPARPRAAPAPAPVPAPARRRGSVQPDDKSTHSKEHTPSKFKTRVGTMFRKGDRRSIFKSSADKDDAPAVPRRDTDSVRSVPRLESVPTTASTATAGSAGSAAGPPAAAAAAAEPPAVRRVDSEGYTIPPAAEDPDAITESGPAYHVDIRPDAIREQDEASQAAVTAVASSLRSRPTVSGRSTRGRRSELPSAFLADGVAGSPPSTAASATSATSGAANGTNGTNGTGPDPSIWRIAADPGPQTFEPMSRTASTAASPASTAPPPSTAPLDLALLSSEVSETVHATIRGGEPTRATVIGEVTVAYGAAYGASAPGTERTLVFRLTNTGGIDRIVPNIGFLTPLKDEPQAYRAQLIALVTEPAPVAFKYGYTALAGAGAFSGVPLTARPVWKIEPGQTSILILYSIHAEYPADTLALDSLTFSVGVGGAAITQCQSLPLGTFNADTAKLEIPVPAGESGKIVLAKGEEQKVLVRFWTDGEASEAADGVGLAFSYTLPPRTLPAAEATREVRVEVLDENTDTTDDSDPFADDAEAATPAHAWEAVATTKNVRSGKYAVLA